MRVTVIPEDKWIRKDEESANLPEWNFDDSNIHAIQWYDTEGEIEYEGKPKPPNEEFTDFSIVQPYVDALEQYLIQQQENVGIGTTTIGIGTTI